MSSPATKAAREELEAAEATILSWYRDMAEQKGTNIIPVFMAVARSVHRAAGILSIEDQGGIHLTDEEADELGIEG